MIKILKNPSEREIKEFEELFERVLYSDFDYYSDEKKGKILKKWKGNALKKKLNNPKLVFIIAEEEDKMVGFLVGKITQKKIAFGRWTGILPKHQRKGLGSAMKGRFEKWAREKNAKELRSSTYKKENRYYLEKLGYEFYKKKKGQGIDLPRYVFRKELK